MKSKKKSNKELLPSENCDQLSPTYSFETLASYIFGIKIFIACVCIIPYKIIEERESNLWWSNIQEVEREISFRTEQGLFYSYYKHLISAPTFFKGIYQLMHDNITEYPSEINILKRMNIMPEVVSAILYRNFKYFQINYIPIDFYSILICYLNGCLLGVIFLISWILSKTIMGGIFTVGLYMFNYQFMSRIQVAINLRENYGFPFFWIEVLCLTLLLQQKHCSKFQQKALHTVIFMSLLGFCLSWQFNQFMLLVQSSAVYASVICGFFPPEKAFVFHKYVVISLLLTAIQQFGNFMLINSLCTCFSLAAIITYKIKPLDSWKTTVYGRFCIIVASIIFTFNATVIFYVITKIFLAQEADAHIYRFLMNKLGFGYDGDFDVQLYNCNGGFQFVNVELFSHLHKGYLLLPYVIAHVVLILMTLVSFYQILRWGSPTLNLTNGDVGSTTICEERNSYLLYNRPELIYHAIHCIVYAILGSMTVRLIYFWTVHMTILAGLLFSPAVIELVMGCVAFFSRESDASKTSNDENKEKSSKRFDEKFWFMCISGLAISIITGIFGRQVYQRHVDYVANLSQFHDPNTVELMYWITNNTAPHESFTGSMQLLAAVKLCTLRPILNHPHYEDSKLRAKTKELYQIYGRQPPHEVHKILKKHKASYIILEDSICRAASSGCRTPDLIDLVNSQIPDHGQMTIPGLIESTAPRFCEDIRYTNTHQSRGIPFRKYFNPVFANPTFRVYRVL